MNVIKKKKKKDLPNGTKRVKQAASFQSKALTSSFQIWKVTLKSYGCPDWEHSFRVDVRSGLTTLVRGSGQEPEKLLDQL